MKTGKDVMLEYTTNILNKHSAEFLTNCENVKKGIEKNSIEILVDCGCPSSYGLKNFIGVCSQEFIQGSKIRIMPDVHTGAGCTIGTTMTIKDKVVPNLVGVDIGCGMHTVKFKTDNLDLIKVGRFIRKKIPSGFNVYGEIKKDFPIEKLKCFDKLKKTERIRKSLGTLGVVTILLKLI